MTVAGKRNPLARKPEGQKQGILEDHKIRPVARHPRNRYSEITKRALFAKLNPPKDHAVAHKKETESAVN